MISLSAIMNTTTTNFLPSTTPKLPDMRFPGNIIKRNSLTIKREVTTNAKQDKNDQENSDDQDMIVLRMRIKNMKVSENKEEAAKLPSSDWLEWEKKVFVGYHEHVCNSMEMLRSCLMSTRPTLTLGMLMVVAMSVPFSSYVALVNALKVAKGLLAGCHVCVDIDF